MLWSSGSQPGCRGKLECRDIVSRVLPKIDIADQGCRETKMLRKTVNKVESLKTTNFKHA